MLLKVIQMTRMALVEATPADVVGARPHPLHRAAARARSAALARRLLARPRARPWRRMERRRRPASRRQGCRAAARRHGLGGAGGGAVRSVRPRWPRRGERGPATAEVEAVRSAEGSGTRASASEADPDAVGGRRALAVDAAPAGRRPRALPARAAATRAPTSTKRLRAGEVALAGAAAAAPTRSINVNRLRDGKRARAGTRSMTFADRGRWRATSCTASRRCGRGGGVRARQRPTAAMALVEATPADAVGADGRTPLHHAAAFARSAALLRGACSRSSPRGRSAADAGGKSAFELLPSTATEEQATVLFEACGPRPGVGDVGPRDARRVLGRPARARWKRIPTRRRGRSRRRRAGRRPRAVRAAATRAGREEGPARRRGRRAARSAGGAERQEL